MSSLRPALTTASSLAQSPNSRFLSDLKQRIGKCITFGCPPSQLSRLGILTAIANQNWRQIVAGTEGFAIGTRGDLGPSVGVWRRRVEWGDQDSMGHVNNVVYNRWAETSRVNFIRGFATRWDAAHRREWEELWTPRGIGLILKSIVVDFKLPLEYPDSVTVLSRIRERPRAGMATMQLESVVLSEVRQRVAARVREENVIFDYGKRGKSTMPGFMLEAFGWAWEMQEQARREAEELVGRLEWEIRDVERGTWDKEGAVEDLGSAIP